ncbi:hypothetical protein COCNU_14G005930 [Cocos nucifera]|uniref:Glycosyltransferase family 28 N-terminal domain-containing protein n=1 Tax=Cocos nucifera TaxID=13894 RepID=A0A8K0NCZ6_COCNU|nr:hypothetical protein COCNU_14G005930 [Cocos nucifera]
MVFLLADGLPMTCSGGGCVQEALVLPPPPPLLPKLEEMGNQRMLRCANINRKGDRERALLSVARIRVPEKLVLGGGGEDDGGLEELKEKLMGRFPEVADQMKTSMRPLSLGGEAVEDVSVPATAPEAAPSSSAPEAARLWNLRARRAAHWGPIGTEGQNPSSKHALAVVVVGDRGAHLRDVGIQASPTATTGRWDRGGERHQFPFSPLTYAGVVVNSDRAQYLTFCLAVDRESTDLPSTTPIPPPGAELRVVFSGGGSGGHIYPAIAIADELMIACPDAKILFIGTATGMESAAVPAAGYEYATVPRTRLARPLLHPMNLFLPFHLLRSIAASWKILREFCPQIVVGTGGYVAAPVCFAAVLSGIKIAIQEQNSFPGLTNRALAPYAEKIFLAFNGCVKHFPKKKCLVYGNPVRLSLRRYTSKVVARSHFFPKAGSDKAQVVLVLGGSAGAGAINVTVLNMYYEMLQEHKNRYIIWQTGAEGYSEMESLVKNNRRLLLTP